jgi:hypothetical protein
MKVRSLTLGLLLLLISQAAFSQKKLSKDEILDEYRKTQSTPGLGSIFRANDQSWTRKVFDELLMNNVDTLVVYSVSCPGCLQITKNDSCSTKNSNGSYFFWKKNGKYFSRVSDERCKTKHVDVNGKVVRFATDNFPKIKGEFFMEAISGATKTGETLVISEGWADHDPKYSILLFFHGQYHYLTFTQNGLTDRTSLFLDYNKELTSFELFELIKRETASE